MIPLPSCQLWRLHRLKKKKVEYGSCDSGRCTFPQHRSNPT